MRGSLSDLSRIASSDENDSQPHPDNAAEAERLEDEDREEPQTKPAYEVNHEADENRR